jgi:hypothetical protein
LSLGSRTKLSSHQNVFQFIGIPLLGLHGVLLGLDAHILNGMKSADFSQRTRAFDEATALLALGTLAPDASDRVKVKIIRLLIAEVGARTMDVDPGTHKIYLPTAELEEQKPGSRGRPTAKPGSFMTVVVGRQ